jgi:hypothetical protein
MCRTVAPDGKEKSNCIACQMPCIDIDAERDYWQTIAQPQRTFIYYSYLGLVIGYFLYYYLYAGNWDYYFSGVWAHDPHQLQALFKPGFYGWSQAIPIPKIVAVPLTLGVSSLTTYALGRVAQKRYRAFLRRQDSPLPPDVVQHQIFCVLTYSVFNLFFVFAGRPFIALLPLPVQYAYTAMLGIVSTFWLCRVWPRRPESAQRMIQQSQTKLALAEK